MCIVCKKSEDIFEFSCWKLCLSSQGCHLRPVINGEIFWKFNPCPLRENHRCLPKGQKKEERIISATLTTANNTHFGLPSKKKD